MSANLKQLMIRAELAKNADRHEDLKSSIKNIVELEAGRQIKKEERTLISIGLTRLVESCLSSWRIACTAEQTCEDEDKKAVMTKYRERIERELSGLLSDDIKLLDTFLIVLKEEYTVEEAENAVSFLKIKGDWYQHKAEVSKASNSQDYLEFIKSVEGSFQKALDIAVKFVSPTNQDRLELALNFAILNYEILKNPAKACEVAQRAFEDAMQNMHNLNADETKTVTETMQTLRGKLDLWMSQNNEEEEEY